MQTFLPYRDFARSAEVLDSPRLGKQRVETLQVLRALELGEYGWRNHPVVRMWRGRTAALVVYGLEVVRAWQARGHADSTYAMIAEFAPDVERATQGDLAARGVLPGWLGDGRIHLSHRSALVRKDPGFYRPVFGDVPDDLPYHWPEPDPVPPPPPPRGRPLWVVRAPTDATAAEFLEHGYAAVPPAGPRSAKGRRQVEAFAGEMRPGDLVGLPLDAGTRLALGEVTGPAVEDRRTVRWYGELPRAAVHPSSHLQDPRSLFRVHLAETVDVRAGVERATGGGSAEVPARTAG